MDLGFILLWLVIAAWMGLMITVGLVALKPETLRLLRTLICPPGTEMIIEKYTLSYHRPGEYGLGVYYFDQNHRRRDIRGRALLTFWGLCSLAVLPAAFMVLEWFKQLPR